MKFKVHLMRKNTGRDKDRFALTVFIGMMKIKLQLYYWGLSPAFTGELPVQVNLDRNGRLEKVPAYDFEVNLFLSNPATELQVFLSNLKTKMAYAGIGLAAAGGFLGASAGRAEAVSLQSAAPVTMEKIKSSTPVVPGGLAAVSPTMIALEEYNKSPFNLAYYHNNVGSHTNTAHTNTAWSNAQNHNNVTWQNAQNHNNMQWQNAQNHNNVQWENLETHGNTPWGDSSQPHSNAWHNVPHSNVPQTSHTNVSSGDVPTDYLY